LTFLCEKTFTISDGHEEIAACFLERFGFGGLRGWGGGIAFGREGDFKVDYFGGGMTT